MDSVPDGVLQHVLGNLTNARDIAISSAVARRWHAAVPFLPALFFPRNAFDGAGTDAADATVGRMVAAAHRLEELVVYCPFSPSSLAEWLALRRDTLRSLELRMDTSNVETPGGGSALDPLARAEKLEALRLWGVSMAVSPAWRRFDRLKILEITGGSFRDEALRDALRACPNLIELALLGCDGGDAAVIELERLERCRLDFLGPGNSSLFLVAPRLVELQIQGFGWLHATSSPHLRSLSISKTAGRVNKVELGKMPELDHLSLRGVQWSWSAVCAVLKQAGAVSDLVMRIEFCGDHDALQPFPEVDFVEFFNAHPKLRRFEIHGAMFAALCQKNSLKNLDQRFVIPCLEDVVITVRSPLNAEQKLSTLESLVVHAVRLREMVLRILQMKNCHDAADDFFEEVCRFRRANADKVRIE